MKCPECKSKKIITENNQTYCNNCGLILSEDYMVLDEYGTDNHLLPNSFKIDSILNKLEKKYNYDSKAAQRFRKFKSNYFDLFEKILLSGGYKYVNIHKIFYNHFCDWYSIRKHRISNRKREDIIYDFLYDWEI